MNSKMKSYLSLAAVICALLIASCGSSGTTAATKTSVGSALAGDVTVELLTEKRLETGMVPIYLKLTDASGKPVTDAAVTFFPLMNMTGGITHTAPMYGPPALDADGFYRCDTVFQMPTSDSGYWDLKVTVERPGSAKVETVFQKVNIADSGRSAAFMYTDPSTTTAMKYIASLNFEAAPKVGLNPVIMTVHVKQDMMTFPPVDGLTISVDPQMPSMGHGSPGSVDPVFVSQGKYSGKVSFSMTGPWEITATIKKDGVELGKPVFKITF